MAKKSDKPKGSTVCSFCLEYFTQYETWWVDLKMHRSDPNCNTYYSIPTCGKCKDDPENSWIIVKVSQEPKVKKTKGRNEKAV